MRQTKIPLPCEPWDEKLLTLPPFKHRRLKKLAEDQKEAFQKRIESFVLEFSIRSRVYKSIPKNEDIKRALLALEKHLNAICEIACTGSLDDSEAALALVIDDWDNALNKILEKIPKAIHDEAIHKNHVFLFKGKANKGHSDRFNKGLP